MTIQIELWQLLSAVGSLGALIVMAFWAMAKLIIRQIGTHLDAQDGRLKTLEDAMSRLALEMARDYVRRDDYVRDIGTLATKFEALAINVERMFRENARETLQMIKSEIRK